MNLINSSHEANVRDLLNTLDHDDLLSLARTSTGNRILPQSSQEAIETILLYTADLGRLFSYRRLTAQALFNYLHKNRESSMGFANKTQMIIAVQNFWAKQCGTQEVTGHPGTKRRAYSDPETEGPKGRKDEVSRVRIKLRSTSGGKTDVDIIASSVRINASHNPISTSVGTGQSVERECTTGIRADKCCTNEGNQSVCVVAPFAQPVVNVMRSDEFTRDFCEWYFRMVNRLQPECIHLPGDTFREDIFYNNSYTDIYFIGQSSGERHAQGGGNTFGLLRDTFVEFKILFSPNLENGTQAYKSDYGMVKICCCGTLHHKDSFVGIFEQETGLVCSPNDHAWKIMYIKINLKQCSILGSPPSLPPCQVFEIET
nr:uncharacterized protein LOC123754272 [Procambarus clarkii]XP_045592468.1 uncharacterized protein LOC123754272 [Procambarus clarkii]XP_045592469.1 uncharacterized protein LOC123754272 [Procambarus clarkii]XP_045592470.1 uncharacterized protein LOC123754272 [Procambarus clarkii]